MFKENRPFWIYIIGIIVLMVFLYFVMVSYEFPFVGFLTGKPDEKEFKYDEVPVMAIQSSKDYRAKVHTNKGTIEIDLYEDNAPQAVNSFVFLSNEGYYEEVKFHRVIKDFLVQVGSRNTVNDDPDDDALGYPGYYFDDEINWSSLGLDKTKQDELAGAGYSNDTKVQSRRLEKYSVAMANAGPDTNGSQFFILLASSSDYSLRLGSQWFRCPGKAE